MPAPENNFQSGQPVDTNFLSDALLVRDIKENNSLTEFAIIATVCGWAHSHRHLSMAKRTLSNPMQAFWDRHRRVERVLAPRIATMPPSHPVMMRRIGPIPLFTHVMVYTMTIYTYRTMMDCVSYHDQAQQTLVEGYSKSFYSAVMEMSNLSNALSQMSCFKVNSSLPTQYLVRTPLTKAMKQAHPFCPIALYLCIECLTAFNENGGGFTEQLKLASRALDNLRRNNNLGEDCRGVSDGHNELALLPSQAMEQPKTWPRGFRSKIDD